MLANALAQTNTRHESGARERHRQLLQRAIDGASAALAAVERGSGDLESSIEIRLLLVKAHAVRAEDARYGAGQLSRGSQRAPTLDACNEGWQRVEAIVAGAEESAREAARIALELRLHEADAAARLAETAAREARRIVNDRNHAYTFHTDPGFSFGEGWYLAAAAVLAGVAIQIEPDMPQTSQAERFLRDAGLASRVTPYRSRPRANKQLPEIVAQAFRRDPHASQRALRAAFLGAGPIPFAIADWADRSLARFRAGSKVLIWLRYCEHHPARNTLYPELVELSRRTVEAGLVPLLVGDAVRNGEPLADAVDMTLWWKEPLFQGADMRRAQLLLFEHLVREHSLVGQLGVTTAGMDGPALMGLPTMYLTADPNVRLGEWVGAIPGYEEVVRSEGYLARLSDTLRRWAALATQSVGTGRIDTGVRT